MPGLGLALALTLGLGLELAVQLPPTCMQPCTTIHITAFGDGKVKGIQAQSHPTYMQVSGSVCVLLLPNLLNFSSRNTRVQPTGSLE